MIGKDLNVSAYLDRLQQEVARLDQAAIQKLSDLLYAAWSEGRFVFICGNGGSATTASHLAEDFAKGSLMEKDLLDESKRRLKVLSLTDNVGWMTAISNDLSYEQVFVQQLMHYGSPGDLLIAISGSGNSKNVLAAVDWANRHGLVTYGLTGFSGGRLKQMQQHGLHVALDDMGMVEALHVCAAHWWVDDLYARVNRQGRHC
jgi:D-sedoheptulose 7-phosphate isomerase